MLSLQFLSCKRKMAPKNSFWLSEQHENVVSDHLVYLKKKMWVALEKKGEGGEVKFFFLSINNRIKNLHNKDYLFLSHYKHAGVNKTYQLLLFICLIYKLNRVQLLTCGKNICCYSQKSIRHNALWCHCDVELPGYITVNIRPKVLQLITWSTQGIYLEINPQNQTVCTTARFMCDKHGTRPFS